MQLIRGQKAKLSDVGASDVIDVALQVATSATLDVSAFGLDAAGKLSDDNYFIFYNQRSSPCGGITLQNAAPGDAGAFSMQLAKLPPSIVRIVFTVTIDGAGNMGQIGSSAVRFMSGGSEVAKFAFQGSDFSSEKAIMVAELYKKDVWRLAANGQGFNGGLQALLESFGGAVVDAPPPPAKAPPAPVPVTAPAPTPAAAPAPAAPKVNLGKITLDKRGSRQAISLKKGPSGASGATRFHVNLNWDQPGGAPKKTGFFGFGKGKTDSVDLDLGCMFKLTTGFASCIQPLGGNFGSKTEMPFIFLDKDDRSGAASDGENMTIFKPELIEKLVIFAMIYEGTANFSHVNARVIIKDDTGTEILIKMDNPEPGQPFCVAALLERRDGGLEIVKEDRYFAGHRFCDQHYGFGFNWKAGSK